MVKNSAQARFFQRLGSPIKQMHIYPGFFHAIFHEKDRHRGRAAVRDFVEQSSADRRRRRRCSTPISRATPATNTTASRAPLPAYCPRRLSFAIQKLSLKTVAKLSEGVRLGWRTGFDSGQSLDYIYENKARGITPLGKLIDRVYLTRSAGAASASARPNLERALLRTIEQVRQAAGEPVRLLDIAAGPGRYMLEAVKTPPGGAGGRSLSVLLRDHNRDALEAGPAARPGDGLGQRDVRRGRRLQLRLPRPGHAAGPTSPSCPACTSCSRTTRKSSLP